MSTAREGNDEPNPEVDPLIHTETKNKSILRKQGRRRFDTVLRGSSCLRQITSPLHEVGHIGPRQPVCCEEPAGPSPTHLAFSTYSHYGYIDARVVKN